MNLEYQQCSSLSWSRAILIHKLLRIRWLLCARFTKTFHSGVVPEGGCMDDGCLTICPLARLTADGTACVVSVLSTLLSLWLYLQRCERCAQRFPFTAFNLTHIGKSQMNTSTCITLFTLNTEIWRYGILQKKYWYVACLNPKSVVCTAYGIWAVWNMAAVVHILHKLNVHWEQNVILDFWGSEC